MKLIPFDSSSTVKEVMKEQDRGIIFKQKTGFLRRCNALGFRSIVSLIERNFNPFNIYLSENSATISFDYDEKKMVYLFLKQEEDNKKKRYIYGEAPFNQRNNDFHLTVIEIIKFISKNFGTSFYVDDTANSSM